MQQATNLFNNQQRQQIEQAVVDAESKTSCEIVPVVATASGRYDRAEDIIGLWLAVMAAIAIWLLFPRPVNETGSWGGMPEIVGVLILIASMIVAFMLGAVAGSKIGWLRRLFTPQEQLRDEVSARARELFFDKRVHHTSGATGLLIYVSLFEHIAVVLGDQQIQDKLGQQAIDSLCEELTLQLQSGDATGAICSTISAAGELLSAYLPREDEDVNELEDALVLID